MGTPTKAKNDELEKALNDVNNKLNYTGDNIYDEDYKDAKTGYLLTRKIIQALITTFKEHRKGEKNILYNPNHPLNIFEK